MSSHVTVASFTTPWEARIVCGLLESEGVLAWLASEHHVWIDWPLSQALGGVRLQVHTEDAARAAEILAARSAGDFRAALEEQFGESQDTCRHCGSVDFRETPMLGTVAISLMGWLLAAPSPIHHRRVCVQCGEAPAH